MGKIVVKTIGWNNGIPTGLVGTVTDLGSNLDISNISQNDVAARFNLIGAFNLKDLCLSTRINRWAAYKPWRRGSTGIDNGMVLSGNDIIYDKPTDASGYFLGDFAAYNHNAPIPGIIVDNTILTFTTGEIRTFSRFISLPEFDLRSVHTNIKGVIVRSSEFTELTNSVVASQTIPISSPSTTCPPSNTVNFYVPVTLGYTEAGGTVVVPFCNFPNLDTLLITAYNISPPVLNGMYREIDGNILLSWAHRDSLVANGYVRLERSINSSAYSTVYQGTGTSYSHSAVVGNTYDYRLSYQSAGGLWVAGYSYVQVIPEGGGPIKQ